MVVLAGNYHRDTENTEFAQALHEKWYLQLFEVFSAISAYLCDLCVTLVARNFSAEITEIRREDFKSRQGLLFVQSRFHREISQTRALLFRAYSGLFTLRCCQDILALTSRDPTTQYAESDEHVER